MPEDELAATKPPPPPMEAEEEHGATTVQSPRLEEEEEVSAATRPEPEDENSIGSKSAEENTEIIQPVTDEMEAEPPAAAEEDNAATTRPEPEDENPIGSKSAEENTEIVQPVTEEMEAEPRVAAEEDNAATTRPEAGQENEAGSEPREEAEETAATTIQIARKGKKKAKPTRPENGNESEAEPVRLELPTGRVKKIMKLDKDINKVNSEALHLVACSTQLFLQFLAEGSAEAAAEKKRKIVKLEHIRTAAKRHQATKDFLVDELSVASQPSEDPNPADRSRSRTVANTPTTPAGSRRIDDFFRKQPATEVVIQTEES